jgi:glycerol-3-phosphate responsive antiterminator
MILKFVELDFVQGIKFMLLAYSSAFIYKNLENSGAISVAAEN